MDEHIHDDACDCNCGECGAECDCGDETITLTDENGVSTDFVIVEGAEHDGAFYVALIEADKADDDDCEFIILKAEEDGDEEVFVSIDDEDEFNLALQLLQAKIENAGTFQIEEPDEEG